MQAIECKSYVPELCDIELDKIVLYGAVLPEKLTVTQQVKKISPGFEVFTAVTMKYIVNVIHVRALANNSHNTNNKLINIKLYLLHTICHYCDMFRSIFVIFRELLNINKRT